MTCLLFRFVLFICVFGFKPFEVPQRLTKPRGFEDDPLLSYADADLPEEVKRMHALDVLEAERVSGKAITTDVGLVFNPSPALDFGLQEICRSASLLLIVRNEGLKVVSIWNMRFSDPQLKYITEGNHQLPVVLNPNLSIGFKISLFPSVSGDLEATMSVVTSLGTLIYPVRGQIKPNQFDLEPVILTSEVPVNVYLYNSLPTTLQIFSVYPLRSSLIVEPEYPKSWKIPTLVRQRLFTVRIKETRDDYQEMVVVSTTEFKLHIPVSYHLVTHSLSISPKILYFGIVNLPSIRHSVRINVTNYEPFPVNITSLISDTPGVSVRLLQTTLEPLAKDVNVAVAFFSPKTDRSFVGYIRMRTNVTGIVKLIPFRGVAYNNLIRYDLQTLVYNSSDLEPRDVMLTIGFSYPISVVSVKAQSPGFYISSLISHSILNLPQPIFRLAHNVSAVQTEVSYLALETDMGVVSLPVILDEGMYSCTVLSSNVDCGYTYTENFGQVPLGDPRKMVFRIKNIGYYFIHLFVECQSSVHSFTAVSITALERLPLFSQDCKPLRFLPLAPSSSVDLELQVIPSADPQFVSALVHISHHVMKFSLTWELMSGKLVLSPKELVFKDVFFQGPVLLSVMTEHTFPRPLYFEDPISTVDSIVFYPHQSYAVAKTPTRTWDVMYPIYSSVSVGQFYSSSVQLIEVQGWREVQIINHQNVTGTVTFRTSIIKETVVPFSANFSPPKMVPHTIDFGFVNLRNIRARYFRVFNPGVGLILVQPLLLPGKICDDDCDVGSAFEMMSSVSIDDPSNSIQSFFLSEKGRNVINIKTMESGFVGPILFRPRKNGESRCMLYLRNNLTFFEPVELVGYGAYTHLTITQETTLRGQSSTYRNYNSTAISINLGPELLLFQYGKRYSAFSRMYRLTNQGNTPLFVSDLVLEGQFCSLHGFQLLTCHDSFLLYPNRSAEVGFVVRPTFIEATSTVDLWVISLNEVFVVHMEMTLPVESLDELHFINPPMVSSGVLYTLLFVSFGVLLSAVQELKKVHRVRRFLKEKPSSDPVLIPAPPSIIFPPAEKKPGKRHRKRKVEGLSIDLGEPAPQIQESPMILPEIQPPHEILDAPQFFREAMYEGDPIEDEAVCGDDRDSDFADYK